VTLVPFYRYTISPGGQRSDLVASDLPDDAAALKEAAEIVRDMKENHESGWWNGRSLKVTEGERKVSEINFIETRTALDW
jgi:hypothetical protein